MSIFLRKTVCCLLFILFFCCTHAWVIREKQASIPPLFKLDCMAAPQSEMLSPVNRVHVEILLKASGPKNVTLLIFWQQGIFGRK